MLWAAPETETEALRASWGSGCALRGEVERKRWSPALQPLAITCSSWDAPVSLGIKCHGCLLKGLLRVTAVTERLRCRARYPQACDQRWCRTPGLKRSSRPQHRPVYPTGSAPTSQGRCDYGMSDPQQEPCPRLSPQEAPRKHHWSSGVTHGAFRAGAPEGGEADLGQVS